MYTYHAKLHTFTKGNMDAMISVNRHSTVAVKVRLIYGMAVYTPKKLAIILKLEKPFIYTLKTRSPGSTFSQIHVLVGDGKPNCNIFSFKLFKLGSDITLWGIN